MNNVLNEVERLRPRPQPLDPTWSERALRAITADPPVRRRRSSRIAAATAALVLGTAGVAYAAGLVPGFVVDNLDDVSSGGDVTDVSMLADLTLPDGRRVGIWSGRNDEGDRCVAIVDGWDGAGRAASGSYGCGAGFAGSYSAETVDFVYLSDAYPEGQEPPPAYLVVYGERPVTSATAVRVTGDRFDFTVPLNSAGGFGATVPIAPRDADDTTTPDLHFTFLDTARHVVARASIHVEPERP